MSEPRQCVCCGLPASCWEADGPCGHPFCYICVGRDHDEDCVACEEGYATWAESLAKDEAKR